MDTITAAGARLEHATGLPAILDAAYDAFEDMLPAIEAQQYARQRRVHGVRDVGRVRRERP